MWLNLDRLLNKAVEQHATGGGFASIEAEGELVQIVIQMLRTHRSLVGSQQPPLQ